MVVEELELGESWWRLEPIIVYTGSKCSLVLTLGYSPPPSSTVWRWKY